MKQIFYCILFLFPIILFSQENQSSVDSITVSEKDLYIEDYTNQLNIKFEVSNDIQEYDVPFNGESVQIKPNLGFRYAFVFSYKFVSVRLSVRPKSSNQEEKGDPTSFRFRFQLLFDKWSHHFEYNQIKGYYIIDNNLANLQNANDSHIQFPDLTTKVLSGTTAYKFNDNYSLRATISQTESQLKSAGSFIPAIDYWYYDIGGLDNYINKDGDEIDRINYLSSSGFDLLVNLGYHYTFVYKKWFANAFLIPGIGIDFNKTTTYLNNTSNSENYQDLLLSVNGGVGIGYNSKKIFFGGTFTSKVINEKYNVEKIQFKTSKNSFYIYFGYRFRAPKTITKPIDGIEEKIPLLKKD